MSIVKLESYELPRPPREIRRHAVEDSRERVVGYVAELYVKEEDRSLRFLDVVKAGLLGLGKRHYLIPIEAIASTEPGLIRLEVDRETVEGAPTFPNPHTGPDPEYQRTLLRYYGYEE